MAAPFNILVVEPDSAEAAELMDLLAGCGPPVSRADAPDPSPCQAPAVSHVREIPAALTTFDRFRPQVLILGPNAAAVPAAQGIHRLRSCEGLEAVPILAVLDETTLESAAELDSAGDDILCKPYNRQLVRLKLSALRRYCDFNRALVAQVNRMRRSQADFLKEQAGAGEIFRNMGQESCLEETGAIRYHLSPRAILNGDLLAAAWAPGGKLMILLGDFTGHGLAAAVGAVPLTSIFYSMVPKGFTLSQIARELNLKLHTVLPTSMFCCAVLLELDVYKQHLRILNAGMPAACLARVGGRQALLESRHLPLGVVRQLSLDDAIQYVQLEAGDRLYLWSDGIHEARNPGGEMFGEQRLLSLLRETYPAARFERILAEISRFGVEQQDDLSLVEVSVDGVAGDPAAIRESRRGAPPGGHLSDWSFAVTLGAGELRELDLLPLMHRLLAQFPGAGPLRDTLAIVLGELVNNAVEHGLLELDSGLKRTDAGFAEYYRRLEVGRRQLRHGWIRIELASSRDGESRAVQLVVADSGPGLPPEMDAGNPYSGRGLALVRSVCRRLEFGPGASEVRAIMDWPAERSQSRHRQPAPLRG